MREEGGEDGVEGNGTYRESETAELNQLGFQV